MVKFLPAGIAMGGVIAVIFFRVAERIQRKRGKGRGEVLPTVAFWMYVSIMLIITFFSRESGSWQGLDLELFSTWGINDRNNALVVENVLLFIPYGFLGPWAFAFLRKFFVCGAFGFGTSLLIESLQLVTRSGYFQVDDILTNTLGALIGYLIFRVLFWKKR